MAGVSRWMSSAAAPCPTGVNLGRRPRGSRALILVPASHGVSPSSGPACPGVWRLAQLANDSVEALVRCSSQTIPPAAGQTALLRAPRAACAGGRGALAAARAATAAWPSCPRPRARQPRCSRLARRRRPRCCRRRPRGRRRRPPRRASPSASGRATGKTASGAERSPRASGAGPPGMQSARRCASILVKGR
jgi:hypothetical protein